MGSEHLSSYEVIYEEDTALYAQLQAGEVEQDEEAACAMYEELVEQAAAAGFHQYEIANFARDRRPEARIQKAKWKMRNLAMGSRESDGPCRDLDSDEAPALACRHNINYWRGGSFYGLGPSATSYVRGVRTKNWANTPLYCQQLERGTRAIESREQLNPLARAGETAAFGLRMLAGWPFERFREITGYDLRSEWAEDIAQLTRQEWGRLTSHSFRLTFQGLRFADAAAQLFLRS